jgi:hypothetical protein
MSDKSFSLRCIVCKVEFSESDIEVTEATDILICDLCAIERTGKSGDDYIIT